MAGTPKAQVTTDAALGSAAAATASPLKLHRRVKPHSPTAESPPSPITPTPPPPRGQQITMESFSATVHELMQELAEQRLEAKEQARKLDEQAKVIAYWECHETPEENAAPPQQFQLSPDAVRRSLPTAEDAEWGDEHGGYWRGVGQDGRDADW